MLQHVEYHIIEAIYYLHASVKVNKHQNTKAFIGWNGWGCVGVGGVLGHSTNGKLGGSCIYFWKVYIIL
jgi:hypothetical protein